MTDETSKDSNWSTTLAAIVTYPVLAAIIGPMVFVVTFPLMLYKAWVLVIMWGWFVVPVFRLPPLRLGYACGLLLMLYLLTEPEPRVRDHLDREKFSVAELFLTGFLGPTLSLGVGWLVKAVFCS